MTKDPAEFQFSLRGRLPKKLTNSQADALFHRWVKTGYLPEGVEVRIIIWKPSGKEYQYSSQDYAPGELTPVLGLALDNSLHAPLKLTKKGVR